MVYKVGWQGFIGAIYQLNGLESSRIIEA